jgi:transglutaminase-like putative cysteine protease
VIYALRHRTTYSYEAAVSFARCVLRLTPQSSATQTVLENVISITPPPLSRLERTGAFGEETLTVVIDQPHRALIIEARSRVDVHAPPVEAPADSPGWEAVRAASFRTTALGPEGPAAYLYPTARTPIVPSITDYARVSFTPDRPIIEAVVDLMTRIHADFTYDSEATDVRTAAADAFKARRGVCQDFAHVMISGLRGLGLPVAYVSGYLRTIPPPGKPRLEGADATHAWVSVWCGRDRGWIGFDPTNAIFVENDHIVLAVGRDYADVAPIDGIILAPGEQDLKVEVDVIPQDEGEGPRRAFTVIEGPGAAPPP